LLDAVDQVVCFVHRILPGLLSRQRCVAHRQGFTPPIWARRVNRIETRRLCALPSPYGRSTFGVWLVAH
jgi:hypothetical protein